MLAVLDTLTTAAAILPANIDITPNDSGSARHRSTSDCGRGRDDHRADPVRPRSNHQCRRLGLRIQQLQPTPRLPREDRCTDLLRGRDHHRRTSVTLINFFWNVGQTVS